MRATSAPVVLPEKNGSGPFYLPAGNKCAVLFFFLAEKLLVNLFTSCRTPYSIFLMQRRKDLWGPDGKAFRVVNSSSNLAI